MKIYVNEAHTSEHELTEWMDQINCDHEGCELYDMKVRDIEQHQDAPDYGEDQFRTLGECE